MSTTHGLYSYAAGDKAFVPSRDLPILRSFFSRRTPPEGADFARVENLTDKRKYEYEKLLSLEDKTRLYKYLDDHPYTLTILDGQKSYKREIDKLREIINDIRTKEIYYATPKERTEMVKYYADQMNNLKYAAVNEYEAWVELEKQYRR